MSTPALRRGAHAFYRDAFSVDEGFFFLLQLFARTFLLVIPVFTFFLGKPQAATPRLPPSLPTVLLPMPLPGPAYVAEMSLYMQNTFFKR